MRESLFEQSQLCVRNCPSQSERKFTNTPQDRRMPIRSPGGCKLVTGDGCCRSHDVPWTARVSLDCGERTSNDGLWATHCGHGSVPRELATGDATMDDGEHSSGTEVATGAGWCPWCRLVGRSILPRVQKWALSPRLFQYLCLDRFYRSARSF